MTGCAVTMLWQQAVRLYRGSVRIYAAMAAGSLRPVKMTGRRAAFAVQLFR